MYPSSYIEDENISYLHFHKTYGHHTRQTAELSWGITTTKITWPCDHMATWNHVTNEKRYISTSPKAMTAKLGKVEIYNKGPPSIKSIEALITWSRWVLMRAYYPQSHITCWSCGYIKSYNKWKSYIFIFTWPVTIKLDRRVAYDWESHV